MHEGKAKGQGTPKANKNKTKVFTLPLTRKCTDHCRKTTFLLETGFVHFHDSWWEGNPAKKRARQVSMRDAP